MSYYNSKYVNYEFLRYALVGAVAFIVDIAVLYIFKQYIIPDSLYLSTAIGFMAGISVNYLLCISFVFSYAKESELGKGPRDVILFILIGLVGLSMNEFGMYLGVGLLSIHYLKTKIFITAIVLIWNYLARKVLIFNPDF